MKDHPPKPAHGWSLAATLMASLVVLALVRLMPAEPANAAPGDPGDPGDGEILVFAASSLAPPLQQIAVLYADRSGVKLRFSFASSAALARQIEYGAPADLFITAHPLWLERLAERQRIDMTGVRAIAGNRLVLARPAARPGPAMAETLDVRALLLAPDAGRIATGDPGSVPLGMYARDSLTALGLWDAVSPRLAPAASARAALLQVERGVARLGVLFASDVAGSSRAEMVAEMPPGSYGPIRYLAAPVAPAPGNSAAEDFLALLTDTEALEIFMAHGFSPPQ